MVEPSVFARFLLVRSEFGLLAVWYRSRWWAADGGEWSGYVGGSDATVPTVIVFDLFHTLVSPEDFWPVGFSRERAAAEVLGIDVVPLTTFWDGPGRSRYTGRPVIELFKEAAHRQDVEVTDDALAAALEVYGRYHDQSLETPRSEVITGLLALRDAGWHLALLSNADDREVAAWRDRPLSELLPTACFSYQIGVAKPDPGAYQAILARLDTDPRSAVFVGDWRKPGV